MTLNETHELSLKQKTDKLLDELADVIYSHKDTENTVFLIDAAHGARKVLQEIEEKTKQAKTGKEVLEIVPDINRLQYRLWHICYRALDKVDVFALDEEDLDLYIESVASVNKVPLVKKNGKSKYFGYYMFGWQTPAFSVPEWRKLLERAVISDSMILSEEEEHRIDINQDKTFKLHLQVPREKRKLVLKAIMEAYKKDMQRTLKLFEDQKLRGESPGITPSQTRELGYKAESFGDWKMAKLNNSDIDMASFVFYIHPDAEFSSIQALQHAAAQLSAILQDAGIDLSEKTIPPRYSAPVVSEAKGVLPGMFYVQGDGDWKSYLERVGKLDKYWDKNTNYATRKGFSVQFK